MRVALVAVLAGAAVLASPTAAVGKSVGKLSATVGDDGSISLVTPDGKRVSDLRADVYFIDVQDSSTVQNFHLFGPGVDRSTEPGFVGSARWVVGLQWMERYRYVSDADPSRLRGAFTTDGGPPLVATLGRAGSVTLRTDEGRRVTQLRAGRYWILARDRSRSGGIHLRGRGVNESTSARFRGEIMWIVDLRRGTYRLGPGAAIRVT